MAKSTYNFKSAYGAWWFLNQHLPNPDSVLQKTGQGLTAYRTLLTDAHLAAVLESRESATLSQDWRIERGKCPQKIYNSIEKWFFSIIERKMGPDDLSRDEITSNILDVIYWGYQPTELTWDLMYGMWMPVYITPKPPEWFIWTVSSAGSPELRFLSKNAPLEGEPPPDPYTLICPRIKPSYTNPYGRGVASRCFWPIAFKKAGLEFWLNSLERFGTPWVKGTMPANSDDTVMNKFKDDLITLVQDAVVVVAGEQDVSIMEAQSTQKSPGFMEMCNYMDSQMTKTILGHTLNSDSGDKGSYAAIKGAMSVRGDIQVRDTAMMRNIWADIINLIMYRNGYGETERPRPVAYRADEIDTERSTRDDLLNRTGVRFSKSYYMKAYHLDDDDIENIVDPSGKQFTGETDADKLAKNPAKDMKDGAVDE